jgi:hypothetical protein
MPVNLIEAVATTLFKEAVAESGKIKPLRIG